VLPEVGFDYDIARAQDHDIGRGDDGGGSYQEVCARCRRRLVALAQSVRVGGFG
jgi:hypothetical protein